MYSSGKTRQSARDENTRPGSERVIFNSLSDERSAIFQSLNTFAPLTTVDRIRIDGEGQIIFRQILQNVRNERVTEYDNEHLTRMKQRFNSAVVATFQAALIQLALLVIAENAIAVAPVNFESLAVAPLIFQNLSHSASAAIFQNI